ncbi:MAG: hypothetical protein FJ033_03135 [Chloroflexi bacterium]|nr:hypothetical protein [Chloroflexota bacterium]
MRSLNGQPSIAALKNCRFGTQRESRGRRTSSLSCITLCGIDSPTGDDAELDVQIVLSGA